MDLTITQKKKHILLFNRLYRQALKEELIPTPSKLSDDKIEKLFDKLFMKKDHYYVPKMKNQLLVIDEDEFKKLIPKTKQPKEEVKKPMEEPKKEEPKKEEPKKEEPKDVEGFKDVSLLKQAIEEYYPKKFGKTFIINDEIPNYDNSIKQLVKYIKKTFNKNDLDDIKILYNKPLDREIADLQTNYLSGKAKVELNKKIAKLKNLMVEVPKEKVKKEKPKKKEEPTEEEIRRQEIKDEETRLFLENLQKIKRKKTNTII
jgi:hypothetical protein